MRRVLVVLAVGLLGAFPVAMGGAVAWAAPGGVPGAPDKGSGGQPPSSDVVHVMQGNSAGKGGGSPFRTKNLSYHGGKVATTPTVYLVLFGSQWGSDPSGEAPRLVNFLGGLGGSETWSRSTTQYCQNVPTGTISCAGVSGAQFVTQPGAVYGGSWSDTSSAAPVQPSQTDLANEAKRAATHFGVSGSNVQFVIATAHGNNASGFGTSYCAWHSSTSMTVNNVSVVVPYTNLPYITDAGASCGMNFVNSGSTGTLDGVTIVEGHEYAETVTDPSPSNGWLDSGGAENGDKCAWLSSGQGAATDISLSSGSFAVQSLWSNNFNSDAGGCVISYTNAATQH